MNHLIQTTADSFIRRLPAGTKYFTLNDLRTAQFPDFLIQRIAVELENNLAESIVPPKSEWADMQAEPVIAAWEHFLYAIHEATRMPSVHARTVIETSIEDVLELLLEPRRQTVSYLFGRSEKITFSELEERVSWLVVYKHFGDALVRYAKKKELTSIDVSLARRVIHAVDDKIVAGFTPLTWTQSLDEFFMLVGERAEPDLLSRYFADRNRPRLAILLGQRNAAISRTELVELLSQPNFDEESSESTFLRYAEPQPTDKESSETEPETTVPVAEPDSVPLQFQSPDESVAKNAEDTARVNMDNESSTFDSLHRDLPGHHQSESEYVEEEGLNHEEAVQDSKDGYVNEISGKNSDNSTEQTPEWAYDSQPEQLFEKPDNEPVVEKDNSVYEPVSSDEFDRKPIIFTDEDHPENTSSGESLLSRFNQAEKSDRGVTDLGNQVSDEEEVVPLWKRFKKDPAEEEKAIIDLTMADPLPDPYQIQRIEYHLSDKRDEFLLEIFAGDVEQWDEVVRTLATFTEWPPAGKYIAGQVFRMNKIDMYSEIGIDFLDRMQSYFLEKTRG